MPLFELACIAIIAVTLALMVRRRPAADVLLDYALLAAASWAGEQICVVCYRHYQYAPVWHGWICAVPVLVPLIWPLVILSARDVAASVAPRAGRLTPVLVAALVTFDASLVEVIAVRAGLWSWSEPGHLGVPLIGMLGWGFFAGLAEVALRRPARWRPLALLLALAGTNLLILAAWWGCLRWTLRGSLGDGSLVGLVVVSSLAAACGLAASRRGDGLPIAVAAPRIAAAALFLALLIRVAPGDARLWLHVAAVAVPYLLVTRIRASGSLAART